jgi:1,2-phenylacetyl-CoA epoxidase catalytic subunit
MSVFVKKANGRQEALEGQHDDLVMSLAIAHFISSQQTAEWITAPVEKNKIISENFHVDEYSQAFGNSSFMDWDSL